MKDREFILTTYLDESIKVAKVNLLTGEYHFIKALESEEKDGILNAKTISDYTKKIVEGKLIHEDDVQSYQHHTDLSYLQKAITSQRRRLVHSFRRKVNNVYEWLSFEVTAPNDFSLEENPWVLFSWRLADSESRMIEESLRMLSSVFHKILKVNLTTDTHEEIKVYQSEMTEEAGLSDKMSEWFQKFADAGNVHEEDKKEYFAFTSLAHICSHFRKERNCLRLRYRRKTDGEFRWVSMEIIPSPEYTEDKQVVMLYVRDIHDAYISELDMQKKLEYYCNYDILTGLGNRYFYKNYCGAYAKCRQKYPVAVLFADMNGLKYVNDNLGHASGDAYIKRFSKLLSETFGIHSCCRISGDEFVAFLEHEDEETAKKKMRAFHEKVVKGEWSAAIGYAWSAKPKTLGSLVKRAEVAMYKDKSKYYEKFPERRR